PLANAARSAHTAAFLGRYEQTPIPSMGLLRVRSADLCRIAAGPLFHMTEKSWRTMQRRIASRGDFERFGLVPSVSGAHFTRSLPPEGIAVLLMAAAMPMPNALGLAQHVRRRFNAEAVTPCRITRATRFGDALSRCICDPDIARHLGLAEIAHD